jgi:IS5 family transposase
MNRAREILVRLAKRCGVELRQSYARVGKLALIKHQRYAQAHQFKRANKALRKLRTYLGRVIRDIGGRIEGNDALQDRRRHQCRARRRRLQLPPPAPVAEALFAA